MRILVGIISLFFWASVCSGTSKAANVWVEWEIENNHRIFDGDAEQEKYDRDLRTYVRCGDYRKRRRGCPRASYQQGRYWIPSRRNYKTAWQQASNSYRKSHVHNVQRRMSLYVKNVPPNQIVKCTWRINNVARTTRNCRITETLSLGNHDVAVTVERKRSLAPIRVRQTLPVRDVLVVALGDSFISGEGNPHVLWEKPKIVRGFPQSPTQPASWWDARCHRSLFTGAAIAAAKLAQWNKRISVTFVSYACSGAELYDGLMTGYRGRETVRQVRARYKEHIQAPVDVYLGRHYLQPQIKEIGKVLCAEDGRSVLDECTDFRRPDYLIVSSGGNEIGFSSIVKDLALRNCKADCKDDIERGVIEKIGELQSGFQSLKRRLAPTNPHNVILTEYMDPTRFQNAKFCDDRRARQKSFFGFKHFIGIRAHESRFAFEKVLVKLNAELKDVATSLGWRIVDDLQALSRRKGYCSDKSWFNTYQHSNKKQGELPLDGTAGANIRISTGAMHPNIYGHYNLGIRLTDEFGEDGLLAKRRR